MPYDPSLPFSPLGTSPTSPGDDRDYDVRSFLTIARADDLPRFVGQANLDVAPKIRNQANEGSCTGHAGRTVKQTQERRARGGWRRWRVPEFGPRGIYDLAKQVGGYPQEEGAYVRDVMKALATYGTPFERDWPYRAGQPGKPQPRFWADAQRWRIGAYARVRTLSEVLTVLHTTGPIYAASSWYSSWYRPGPRGLLPTPVEDIGGHAYAIMAADQDAREFVKAGSWGEGYGDGGYVRIPFDYFFNAPHEVWSIPDSPEQPNR